MSATYTVAATTTSAAPSAGSLLRHGAAATLLAAAATSVVGAAGQAAGFSLEVSGAPIPVSGFAAMTVIFSVLGVLLAAVLRRFASRPRTAWFRTTIGLTMLSLVPDVLADAAGSTKIVLMVTHLVAAAIVIPAVARRLRA